MRHRLCVLLFCCLAFVLVAPAQQSGKPLSIVVYNLEAQGIGGSLSDIMTSVIVTELSKSKKLFVRDEKTTIAVLKEKGMAQTDYCNAETCRIDTAKLIKADRIILGNIGKLEEKLYLITIRVADVNGTNIYSQKQLCRDCSTEKILGIIEEMSVNIRTFLETGKEPESGATPPVTPPGPTPPVTSQAGVGSIKITTNPPGAEVFLDAQPVGKTPLTISSISVGIHELTITHQGHSTLTKSVEVSAGQVATVNEILSRRTGSLEVQSNPSGADFWVDGKYIGKTPKKVPGVLVGKHAVKVSLGNYQEFTTEANVETNETASVNATLQGLPGRILVTSTPDGAEVFIDGKKVGVAPYSGQLNAGSHSVRVGKEGYQSAEETIAIEPNKPKTLNVALKKGPDVRGDMVQVPAGEFTMGSNDYDGEKPPHRVYLDAFYIDKYEVTNDQYAACVRSGKCEAAHFDDGSCYVYNGKSWEKGTLPQSFRGGNKPVVCIDWNQAKDYCEYSGKRLPTEAEWEKAARGTDGRKFPWGNQEASCSYAIMNDGGLGCGKQTTWPVGSKPNGASPYGAMDMAGNVWEWVADWYGGDYYKNSPNRNPTGPSSGSSRVLRGGSWDCNQLYLRASYRNDVFTPVNRIDVYGARCARTP